MSYNNNDRNYFLFHYLTITALGEKTVEQSFKFDLFITILDKRLYMIAYFRLLIYCVAKQLYCNNSWCNYDKNPQ